MVTSLLMWSSLQLCTKDIELRKQVEIFLLKGNVVFEGVTVGAISLGSLFNEEHCTHPSYPAKQ